MISKMHSENNDWGPRKKKLKRTGPPNSGDRISSLPSTGTGSGTATNSDFVRRPRKYTVSIALPGSIVANHKTRELQTYLCGQIARSLAIHQVDEVIIFDDGLHSKGGDGAERKSFDANVFLARILQFVETPQYLRKKLFPQHSDLKYAGLLNPVDAPHHMRSHEKECDGFREGVSTDKPPGTRPGGKGTGSFVDVGLKHHVLIDRILKPNMRVTVKLDSYSKKKERRFLEGSAVPPSAPREEAGLYWGYTTRYASDFNSIFTQSPFEGGYDHKIGTSERGDASIDDPSYAIPPFSHLLVVLGGLDGIEACVEEDSTLKLSASEAGSLFDVWLNTCPNQGSRTIRTEEAVTITLARLGPLIARSGSK